MLPLNPRQPPAMQHTGVRGGVVAAQGGLRLKAPAACHRFTDSVRGAAVERRAVSQRRQQR